MSSAATCATQTATSSRLASRSPARPRRGGKALIRHGGCAWQRSPLRTGIRQDPPAGTDSRCAQPGMSISDPAKEASADGGGGVQAGRRVRFPHPACAPSARLPSGPSRVAKIPGTSSSPPWPASAPCGLAWPGRESWRGCPESGCQVPPQVARPHGLASVLDIETAAAMASCLQDVSDRLDADDAVLPRKPAVLQGVVSRPKPTRRRRSAPDGRHVGRDRRKDRESCPPGPPTRLWPPSRRLTRRVRMAMPAAISAKPGSLPAGADSRARPIRHLSSPRTVPGSGATCDNPEEDVWVR
jgi:hypothetical protein